MTKRWEVREFYETVVLGYEGDECLEWPYNANKGYARIRIDGVDRLVSRLVCEEENGPPPTPDHQAAHSCGRGHLRCVTKRHLSWKTNSENQMDRVIHDTHRRGERQWNAKLTEDQVREIRALKGQMTQRAIAAKYGVIQQNICHIHNNRGWGWVR